MVDEDTAKLIVGVKVYEKQVDQYEDTLIKIIESSMGTLAGLSPLTAYEVIKQLSDQFTLEASEKRAKEQNDLIEEARLLIING